MSEKDNCLTLCQELINVFGSELTKIFERELEEPNYMKQTILGSKHRARWAIIVAIYKSFKPMVNILALAISTHRANEHNENKEKEIASIKRVMTDEEIQKATTRSFWSTGK